MAQETAPLPTATLVDQIIDGRYRVTGLLGSGGMGTVYRAEHLMLRRPVAIKLLHPEIGQNPEVQRRFEREALATGRVIHPNCVTVSDAGRLPDGTLFLVLELLDGVSVFEVLEREGRIAIPRALRLMRHVLRGLSYVHAAGIVHRDVKPDNVILVQHEGEPEFAKLLDFGIAKLVEPLDAGGGPAGLGHHVTQHGIVLGTPTYMSPEQAFGQPVDARTDVYSATVMLYELITGRGPYVNEEILQILVMHSSAPIPAIVDAAPDLRPSPELEQLVRDGMAKRRDDRIASAEEYVRRIEALLEPTTGVTVVVPSTPPRPSTSSTPSPFRRPAWLQPKLVGLVAGAALLLVVIIAAVRSGDDAGDRAAGSAATSGIPALLLPRTSPLAAESARRLASGDPEGVVAALQSRDLSRDPAAQLVLGHAQAALRQSDAAARSYLAAVRTDPELARDTTLRTNLALMLDSGEAVVLDAAFQVLELAIRLADDDTARKQLVTLASGHPRLAPRLRARALAEELDLAGEIDRLKSYSLDLEQGETCEDRREAVARLRALGDRRAIPALAKAQKRTRRGGFMNLERRNANACLRDHAAEAIRYLETR